MMMHPETAHTDMPLAPPTVKDRITIHQTILRLTAIYKTVALAIVLIGVVLWLTIINRILHFGRTLDYSGLEALGIDAALIKQYNPFFWWTVVIICTLLFSYLLFHLVQYTRQRASQKVVSDTDLSELLKKMSPAATHVLSWAWQQRRHPITVGVLQQTTAQLGANRYALICLAKKQEQQIQNHLAPTTKHTEPLHHL